MNWKLWRTDPCRYGIYSQPASLPDGLWMKSWIFFFKVVKIDQTDA